MGQTTGKLRIQKKMTFTWREGVMCKYLRMFNSIRDSRRNKGERETDETQNRTKQLDTLAPEQPSIRVLTAARKG